MTPSTDHAIPACDRRVVYCAKLVTARYVIC